MLCFLTEVNLKFNLNAKVSLIYVFISIESGEKDLQDLAQYRVDYDVIITWIKTNEKRLQDVKDEDGKDRESIEKQRVILKVFI